MDNSKDIVKLRHIEITNFKAIDELEIDFPEPDIDGEPDITVIGSKNGVGKTSVLEACSFLRVFSLGEVVETKDNSLADFNRHYIRAGSKSCIIKGTFQIGSIFRKVQLDISRDGVIKLSNDRKQCDANPLDLPLLTVQELDRFLRFLTGLTLEPIVFDGFLYLNSCRKTNEGHVKLETVSNYESYRDITSSLFKLEVVRAMMGQANLFTGIDSENSKETLNKLNELVKEYAGGIIKNLKPVKDAYDLQISPTNGGSQYSFDGLSSGQKEMISTLFLIWHNYNKKPGIVLIDESELHLNAEWHRTFINSIVKMAPENQYIIATHSESIAASVDIEHRVIIEA